MNAFPGRGPLRPLTFDARPLFCLAALILALAPPARAELVDRVAAVVNKDIIALSEVEARAAPELARAANERDPNRRAQIRNAALSSALDQLIGEKLLEEQMKTLGIEVTESDIEAGMEDVRRQNSLDAEQFRQLLRQEGYSEQGYREFLKKQLGRLKLVNLKVRNKVKVSDEDLKAEYARYAKMEGEDAEVHARHILVKVQAPGDAAAQENARKKALALAEEARKPGVDFVELAKRRSEGPSASEGGDLGFFRRGTMVPEFDRVVFKMKTGDISDPIQTRFGYHVIKIDEVRAVAPKPFDEVKDQLKNRLLQNQLERYTQQYVAELRTKAAIEVKL